MISQIDEAIEQDSCKLLVVAGPVCSGKTALFACWKKQHVLKYAEHHDGARIEMVIYWSNFLMHKFGYSLSLAY